MVCVYGEARDFSRVRLHHIETLKGDASKGTYAFTRLLNPGEEYTLRVYACKGENGRSFGEQKIRLDNSFYSKILTNTEGKKAIGFRN